MDQAEGYEHSDVFADMDVDGNRLLEWSEFELAFKTRGRPVVHAKIMWNRNDADRDGAVTFKEFDGFKGIGNGNLVIEQVEFVSFMRRNRLVVAREHACLCSQQLPVLLR